MANPSRRSSRSKPCARMASSLVLSSWSNADIAEISRVRTNAATKLFWGDRPLAADQAGGDVAVVVQHGCKRRPVFRITGIANHIGAGAGGEFANLARESEGFRGVCSVRAGSCRGVAVLCASERSSENRFNSGDWLRLVSMLASYRVLRQMLTPAATSCLNGNLGWPTKLMRDSDDRWILRASERRITEGG